MQIQQEKVAKNEDKRSEIQYFASVQIQMPTVGVLVRVGINSFIQAAF